MNMSAPISICSILLSGTLIAGGGGQAERNLEGYLKRLFPAATAFSPKEGAPPHFKALANDSRSGSQTLLGLAFWTTELEPLERGYDGPIKILVGMDTKGILTGIVVVAHHEPYGYFSVEPPAFAAQFTGKNIRDAFKVGSDIDAVSRASITVSSATRAVRNSARRVATQLLTPPAPSTER
jgi:NosR/NirI family transcriptional regulator, nitrous oxide reductase regulator